jgi:3-oxoacyl-[acyl-carrier protein] reductase
MELRGKVAVVTGGGDGSGRAIAQHLARQGAAVVVSDIDEAGARETVRRVEGEGGRAIMFLADVRREANVRALVSCAEHTFGGLDVRVNNASAPFRPGIRSSTGPTP